MDVVYKVNAPNKWSKVVYATKTKISFVGIIRQLFFGKISAKTRKKHGAK
jgi:hypothetical protein